MWGFSEAGPQMFPSKAILPPSRPELFTTELISVLFGSPYGLPPERCALPKHQGHRMALCPATNEYLTELGSRLKKGWYVEINDVIKYPWKEPIHRERYVDEYAYRHWSLTSVIPPDALAGDIKVVQHIAPVELWGLRWLELLQDIESPQTKELSRYRIYLAELGDPNG